MEEKIGRCWLCLKEFSVMWWLHSIHTNIVAAIYYGTYKKPQKDQRPFLWHIQEIHSSPWGLLQKMAALEKEGHPEWEDCNCEESKRVNLKICKVAETLADKKWRFDVSVIEKVNAEDKKSYSNKNRNGTKIWGQMYRGWIRLKQTQGSSWCWCGALGWR